MNLRVEVLLHSLQLSIHSTPTTWPFGEAHDNDLRLPIDPCSESTWGIVPRLWQKR